MTATMTCDEDIDRDDLTTLLDLSARIVRRWPNGWRTLAVAFRRGASLDHRADALLTLAELVNADDTEGDEVEVLLRAFLPRLSLADRDAALAEMRYWLDRAERFAGASDAGDVEQLIDQRVANWVTVAEHEAGTCRAEARHVAAEAVRL